MQTPGTAAFVCQRTLLLRSTDRVRLASKKIQSRSVEPEAASGDDDDQDDDQDDADSGRNAEYHPWMVLGVPGGYGVFGSAGSAYNAYGYAGRTLQGPRRMIRPSTFRSPAYGLGTNEEENPPGLLGP